MKYSVTFLVFFALCAVAFAATTNNHQKKRSNSDGVAARDAAIMKRQVKSDKKSKDPSFDSAFAKKKALETGTDLRSDIDKIAPLVKKGTSFEEQSKGFNEASKKKIQTLNVNLFRKKPNVQNDTKFDQNDSFAATKEDSDDEECLSDKVAHLLNVVADLLEKLDA